MQPVKDVRASGNVEVCDMLARSLEEARKGRIRYAAIITCENAMHVDIEQAGTAGCEFAANYGFDLLKKNLLGHRQPGAGLGPDFVRYDLSRAPLGWDFASWLVDREMDRVRAGAPAPLKVAFVGDVTRRKWGPVEAQWVEKVMRPLIGLIGAVEDPRAANAGTDKEFYMLRYVTEAAKRGEPVPRFKVPVPDVKTPVDYVTITLREAEHWKHRNSNIEAWSRVGHELRRRGENVVFVRDTAKAGEPFEDFVTLAEAATDINVRAKLYAQAKCNLFVSNGPWWLGLFGTRPWLAFNAVSPDDPFDANKPQMWRDFNGIGAGEQFPWQTPEQIIVWQPDDYEFLLQGWNAMELLLRTAKAA